MDLMEPELYINNHFNILCGFEILRWLPPQGKFDTEHYEE